MYSFYWPKVAVLQDTNDSAESCWHWNRFSRAVISKLLFVGLAAMVSTSELFRKSMRDHPRRERERENTSAFTAKIFLLYHLDKKLLILKVDLVQIEVSGLCSTVFSFPTQ